MLKYTIEKRKFEEAKLKVLTGKNAAEGFGTLNEKTIHAVMKQCYMQDESCHEISLKGYIADIFTGTDIIEIQNGNFGHMRDKLKAFLPEHDVYLVYPFPHKKWICWVDPETGAINAKNKSPITGTIYHALPELFSIKSYLNNPRLHLRFPLIDMEEYRLLDGKRSKKNKKLGSHRYDRIPLEIFDEFTIDTMEDYLKLFPDGLPMEFTVKDFAAAAHIPVKLSQSALKLLYDLGIVARTGKCGNAYLYQVYSSQPIQNQNNVLN